MSALRCWLLIVVCVAPAFANQQEEALSDSVRTALRGLMQDRGAPILYDSPEDEQWLAAMSARLAQIAGNEPNLSEEADRRRFLSTVRYEASRAGVDVQLILAIIMVESRYRKYAISSAGARGYMQIMPFWVGVIGQATHNLFALRTNLRYGTVIFRHYLDVEKGDTHRALARYNGSLGRDVYPNKVFSAQENYWHWP